MNSARLASAETGVPREIEIPAQGVSLEQRGPTRPPPPCSGFMKNFSASREILGNFSPWNPVVSVMEPQIQCRLCLCYSRERRVAKAKRKRSHARRRTMAQNLAEQTGKSMRVARILGKPQPAAHTYHVVSRVIEGRGIFDRAGQEKFRQLLEAYSEMTGIEVYSWCCMSDHFHILLQVPNAEESRSKLDDEEILRRLSLVAQPERVDEVRQTLGRLKDQELKSGYLEYRERLLARMYDLSAFMGGLRQRLSQWYNQRVGRKGPLWEDRFKSVLLEDAANGEPNSLRVKMGRL